MVALPTPDEDPKTRFTEVEDRCYVGRHREWDVSIGVVVGADGAVVVDTRASARQGEALRNDIGRLAPGADLRWVVNTHQHFDHTFGNVAFDRATIYAHENAVEGLASSAADVKRLITEDLGRAPDQPAITAEVLAEVVDTQLRLPDVPFSSVATIDLGDRYVELFHPGRGHTGGDAVIRVPDVDVVFAGDLVEESGPPSYGEDSYPLEWPGSLDLVMGVLTERSVVVPGHGNVVGKDFVDRQRGGIADVATQIQALFDAEVRLDDAYAAGETWPFPADHLRTAIARGYHHLSSRGAGARPYSAGAAPPGVSTLPMT